MKSEILQSANPAIDFDKWFNELFFNAGNTLFQGDFIPIIPKFHFHAYFFRISFLDLAQKLKMAIANMMAKR